MNETQSLKLQAKIPRQKTGGIAIMPSYVLQAIKATACVALFTLLINFFLQGLLNKLLSNIASLATILHMFLVQLNYPLEMMNFFGLIFPLITFDVFPVGPLYEKMFHFVEIQTDYSLTVQYNIVGYGSIFLINNIGSLFLIAVFQLLLCVLLWQLKRYKPFGGMKMQRKVDKIADEALWNGLIQFCASNYLVFCVVGLIASNSLRLGNAFNFTENFCSALAVFTMLFAFVFPTAIFFIYIVKMREVDPNLDKPIKY